MATIVDYNSSTTGQGSYPCHDAAAVGDPQVIGHVFTASETYTLTQISVLLDRNGYLVGNVRCSIYSAPADEPTGAALDSAEVVAATLSVSPSKSWISFTMTGGETLTSGNKYAIVINALSANPPVTGYTNVYYSDTNQTGGLILSHDGETIWLDTYFATLDVNFRTYKTGAEAPTKATNPTPTDSDTDVDFSGFQLSWDDGGGADTFDVYIGETGAVTSVSSAQAGTTYTTTLAELETIFGVSPIDQIIYWRIDATNDDGTTTGDEWNFDARPAKATVPSPTDANTDIVLGLTLTWTGSDVASSYDTLADIGDGLVSQSTELASATWTPSPTIFDYITEYTWRVDSINSFGTTEGDEWTFTTLQFAPPGVTYFYDGYYYRLLIDSSGDYGDHPADGGVEDTDYVVLVYEANFIRTNRVLVAVAENRFWYEDIT